MTPPRPRPARASCAGEARLPACAAQAVPAALARSLARGGLGRPSTSATLRRVDGRRGAHLGRPRPTPGCPRRTSTRRRAPASTRARRGARDHRRAAPSPATTTARARPCGRGGRMVIWGGRRHRRLHRRRRVRARARRLGAPRQAPAALRVIPWRRATGWFVPLPTRARRGAAHRHQRPRPQSAAPPPARARPRSSVFTGTELIDVGGLDERGRARTTSLALLPSPPRLSAARGATTRAMTLGDVGQSAALRLRRPRRDRTGLVGAPTGLPAPHRRVARAHHGGRPSPRAARRR